MFDNDAAEFVFYRTYSRWINHLQRRETWDETVSRFIDYIKSKHVNTVPPKVFKKIEKYVRSHDVMPSMRFLWSAGPAADADNTTIYNCAFLTVDSIESFAECLYILMCGTGVGFSVENQYVSRLPQIPKEIKLSDVNYVIEDSKKGWADSVKELLMSLFNGYDIKIDYNQIRPEGTVLKTMGGRASGPVPLINLHSFIREIIYNARGRQLTTLECQDILNQIAEVVVVGGVRRSSQISLSDLSDVSIRDCKVGDFPARRWMSNNSAVYESKPDAITFLKEWAALAASGNGERGIFNLYSARLKAPKRRNATLIAGTNPCGEIMLRSQQFCNLSEIVVKPHDDMDSLLDKTETAVWIGIIQSTFTFFPYLRPQWKKNCEEERLLGVSITGQMDAPHLLSEVSLQAMKNKALKVAQKASEIMKINMPAAVTCVKPSGTVSQIVNSSSGIHARFSKYYIRRYRISATDPLCKMMRAQGIDLTPENGQSQEDWDKATKIYEQTGQEVVARGVCSIFKPNKQWSPELVNTWVISFPFKAPEGSLTADDLSAIQQLEWYKKVQLNWCEHNASATIYVKPHEWFEVGNWVYQNWDIINGISFLPYLEHNYKQAPYESITKEQYEKMIKMVKKIDYSQLHLYESEDVTQGAKTYACSGNTCELV